MIKVINDAIKSALKITIPSLNSDGKLSGTFTGPNSTNTTTVSRKSPQTTGSPNEVASNNRQIGVQQHLQDQNSLLRPKQTSPNKSIPSPPMGNINSNHPSAQQTSPITNVLSHLHAAKKEAMLKTGATSPALFKTGPNASNKMMPPPSSRKSAATAAPSTSMGVISELDKNKYTLGKWVDTIIVQMNDPSADEVELDDSVKKSNFNSLGKEKEAAGQFYASSASTGLSSSTSDSILSSNTNGHQSQLTTQDQSQPNIIKHNTQEFEYVEGNDDGNDE